MVHCGRALPVLAAALAVGSMGCGSADPAAVSTGALVFPTPQRGVLSDGQSVSVSTDGGRRWVRTLRSFSPVTGLWFADSRHGWALGHAQLFATATGGRSWTRRSEPRQGALAAVQLLTPRIGYGCVGDAAGALLLRTADDGRTWDPLPPPGGSRRLLCGQGTLCFASPSDGWAVANDDGGRQTVFETTDGGRSWSPSLRVTRGFEGPTIGCSENSAWYLVSGSPAAGHAPFTVFVTIDSGRQWRAALASGWDPPTARGVPPARNGGGGAYAGTIDVIGPAAAALLTRCPACGDAHHRRGTLALQLTTDGGEHWTEAAGPRQFLPLVGAFGPVGVSFPTAECGYVFAMAGTGPPRLRLLGTHDGGRTWTALAVP